MLSQIASLWIMNPQEHADDVSAKVLKVTAPYIV